MMIYDIICHIETVRWPFAERGWPMQSYVTYEALIQCGILIVGIIGLVNQIKNNKKK